MTLNITNTVTVYVDLPEEGSPTIRPMQAIDLGNGLFKLLPTSNDDPEDEAWQFSPGTIVRCEKKIYQGKEDLLAVAKG